MVSIFGISSVPKHDKKPLWGRADEASIITVLVALAMMTIAPIFNFILSTTCTQFGCSLKTALDQVTVYSILPTEFNKISQCYPCLCRLVFFTNAIICYFTWPHC